MINKCEKFFSPEDKGIMNKEKPIIFSTSMVKAILEGRKTMTRRAVKPQPPETHTVPFNNGGCRGFDPTIQNMDSVGVSRPYTVGDILWMRETWHCNGVGKAGSIESALIEYKAGEGKTLDVDSERALYYAGKWRWRPPRFMPREASRLTLEVKDVRIERLQDIDEDGAIGEGCISAEYRMHKPGKGKCTAVNGFANLWDKLNAKSGNPWVWVIEFMRVR